jgi:hypothetical protein
MNSQNILLLTLSIASLIFIPPSSVLLAHASGVVYILPQTVPLQSVGSSFTVQVQVAGMDQFDGWDILVRFDSSVINATSISIAGNIFDANTTGNLPLETYHCINGVNSKLSDCSGDGMGTVHSSVVYFTNPPPPQLASGYGLLFTITYKIVGRGTYSPIQFQKIIITNPNPVVISPPQDGEYGIPPGQGFKVTPSPTSARILIGTKMEITLNVSSYGGYSGTVDLRTSVPTLGLNIYLNASSLTISTGQPAYANLTVVSDPAYNQASQYVITVTASSNGFPQTTTITVNTFETPDFIFGASPSKLKVHATSSGSSIITVAADRGFYGSVHLKMDVPSIPGLIAYLGATDFVNVSENHPGSTVFSVRTPPSDVPFVYQINITASSQWSTHLPFPIFVVSPPPDYSFQIGASSFVVQAGQSRTFTLNATSVDYFKGQLYLLASSLSGIKEVFSRSPIHLDFTNSSTTLMTITTDPFLTPGNHYINVTALGTTFLGALGPQVNHSLIVTVTIPAVAASRTIFGLQPLAYFGIVGVLWLGLIGAAVKEIRRPKQKRFLS